MSVKTYASLLFSDRATSDFQGLLKFCSTRANLSLCLRDEGRTLPDFRSVSRSLPELVRNYSSTDCNGSAGIERSASISRPIGTSFDQKPKPVIPVDGIFGRDLFKQPLIAVKSEGFDRARVLPAFMWAAGPSLCAQRCDQLPLSRDDISISCAREHLPLLPRQNTYVSYPFRLRLPGNFIVENGHIKGIFRISGEKAKIDALLNSVSEMVGEANEDGPMNPVRVGELDTLFRGDGAATASSAKSEGGEKTLRPQQYVYVSRGMKSGADELLRQRPHSS